MILGYIHTHFAFLYASILLFTSPTSVVLCMAVLSVWLVPHMFDDIQSRPDDSRPEKLYVS